MSSSMWAVLCIRRSEGSHVISLYSTWAVQCGLSCKSGVVKDLMLNPIQHTCSSRWAVLYVRRSKGCADQFSYSNSPGSRWIVQYIRSNAGSNDRSSYSIWSVQDLLSSKWGKVQVDVVSSPIVNAMFWMIRSTRQDKYREITCVY